MATSEKKKASNKAWKLRNKEKLKVQARKYYLKTKKHQNAKALEWYYANKKKFKSYEKKYKYGITEEEYQQMVVKQQGVCKICNNPPVKFKPVLYVDHDHETGKVRGLLCHFCNAGIGMLKDSPALLKRAIKYLKSNK